MPKGSFIHFLLAAVESMRFCQIRYKALLESHFHASALNGLPENLRSLNEEDEHSLSMGRFHFFLIHGRLFLKIMQYLDRI